MTKFYSLLFALLMSTALLAQSPPQSFSYQTVIRDAGFNVMANQEVVLRLSILEDEPQGLMVYQEKHVETTSAIGLVNLFIGEGNLSSGSFEDILSRSEILLKSSRLISSSSISSVCASWSIN